MKKQSGFTLIELLLVLAIIGIISAIAIPALLGQRARARDKSATSNADSIVSDLVGQYDKAKEAGTDVATAATFTTAIVTTAILPSVFTASNPWNGTAGAPALAYNATVGTETATTGVTTYGTCATTNLGQVQMGYMPVAAGTNGCVVAAVWLNSQFNEVTPAGVAAALTNVYYKTAGIE